MIDIATHFDRTDPRRVRQHYEVLKELGDCLAAAGDGDAAATAYREAATLDPLAPEPHVGLGTVAIQADRLDHAVDAFQLALELDTRCAEAHGGLAIVHQRRGDYAKALDVYLKCLEIDGDNLVALLGLFQTSCRMGTFERIIYYLELYLDRHPGDVSVLFCLASLHVKEGWYADAREGLLAVLAVEPDKPEALALMEEVETLLAQSPIPGATRG